MKIKRRLTKMPADVSKRKQNRAYSMKEVLDLPQEILDQKFMGAQISVQKAAIEHRDRGGADADIDAVMQGRLDALVKEDQILASMLAALVLAGRIENGMSERKAKKKPVTIKDMVHYTIYEPIRRGCEEGVKAGVFESLGNGVYRKV